MDTVELKLCIVTTLTRRGAGTFEPNSPIRVITEIWDAETGDKIAEHDPFLEMELKNAEKSK